MKKRSVVVILFLFALLAWSASFHNGVMFDIDGDSVDGPFGALLALLFTGGGLLLAGFVILLVGGLLALVFAGVGVLCVGGFGVGALALVAALAFVAALALSPLLLPLLLGGLVLAMMHRSRRQRVLRDQPV
ncbi:hypothetical protein HH212_05430 [Massilia forsythiae]|uniref:Uncharacterized protein n=1 Tax=Massilia forsythiae TaxID=2728020 RepID=A0A7Z2ZT13_9BURK|nr:hypothetical protein [Massilia forsythiae]QJD99531.1 hypothetical protein HH212_05430 [Massilia forsythiae]